jgi:hypothetical protein
MTNIEYRLPEQATANGGQRYFLDGVDPESLPPRELRAQQFERAVYYSGLKPERIRATRDPYMSLAVDINEALHHYVAPQEIIIDPTQMDLARVQVVDRNFGDCQQAYLWNRSLTSVERELPGAVDHIRDAELSANFKHSGIGFSEVITAGRDFEASMQTHASENPEEQSVHIYSFARRFSSLTPEARTEFIAQVHQLQNEGIYYTADIRDQEVNLEDNFGENSVLAQEFYSAYTEQAIMQMNFEEGTGYIEYLREEGMTGSDDELEAVALLLNNLAEGVDYYTALEGEDKALFEQLFAEEIMVVRSLEVHKPAYMELKMSLAALALAEKTSRSVQISGWLYKLSEGITDLDQVADYLVPVKARLVELKQKMSEIIPGVYASEEVLFQELGRQYDGQITKVPEAVATFAQELDELLYEIIEAGATRMDRWLAVENKTDYEGLEQTEKFNELGQQVGKTLADLAILGDNASVENKTALGKLGLKVGGIRINADRELTEGEQKAREIAQELYNGILKSLAERRLRENLTPEQVRGAFASLYGQEYSPEAFVRAMDRLGNAAGDPDTLADTLQKLEEDELIAVYAAQAELATRPIGLEVEDIAGYTEILEQAQAVITDQEVVPLEIHQSARHPDSLMLHVDADGDACGPCFEAIAQEMDISREDIAEAVDALQSEESYIEDAYYGAGWQDPTVYDEEALFGDSTNNTTPVITWIETPSPESPTPGGGGGGNGYNRFSTGFQSRVQFRNAFPWDRRQSGNRARVNVGNPPIPGNPSITRSNSQTERRGTAQTVRTSGYPASSSFPTQQGRQPSTEQSDRGHAIGTDPRFYDAASPTRPHNSPQGDLSNRTGVTTTLPSINYRQTSETGATLRKAFEIAARGGSSTVAAQQQTVDRSATSTQQQTRQGSSGAQASQTNAGKTQVGAEVNSATAANASGQEYIEPEYLADGEVGGNRGHQAVVNAARATAGSATKQASRSTKRAQTASTGADKKIIQFNDSSIERRERVAPRAQEQSAAVHLTTPGPGAEVDLFGDRFELQQFVDGIAA